MTNKAQRITIAEACGWTIWPTVWTDIGGSHVNGWTQSMRNKHESALTIPDYLNDLNAMHAATRTLNANQIGLFLDTLDAICVPVHICPTTHTDAVVNATARQRARAFLETLGLWEDGR